MKKIFLVLFTLFLFTMCKETFAITNTYHVNQQQVYKGYITERVWLKDFVLPQVMVSNISYITNIGLPKDAKPSDPNKIEIILGMEQKKPFAVIRVPVYVISNSGSNTYNMVNDFTLTINQLPDLLKDKNAQKKTDVLNSVLASGKFYKIGITQTGIYKIDYNFIVSLGIDPKTIDPSKIRIYGNGGNMLSEDNHVARPIDLIENAISVNVAGSTFSSGDYILFNGIGPTAWSKDSLNMMFNHHVNLYSDTAYYFLSFDKDGAGLRINSQSTVGTGNVTVSSYDYYNYYEKDLVNPAKIGKNWYGEEFNPIAGNLSQTFSFHPGSFIDSIYCTVSFANIQDVPNSSLSVYVNNNVIGSYTYNSTTSGDNLTNIGGVGGRGICGSQDMNIGIIYTPASSTSKGWLNYIEINARRQLIMVGDQMYFRDWRSVGNGNIAIYQLQGATNNTVVWDVTNPQLPVLKNGSLTGSVYTFTQDASILHEFVALNSTNLFSPIYIGQVANQNLHGTPQVDCIIVTAPDFLSQATLLAEHHRSHDNQSVVLATTTQVYNEFSSGGQDISAIRDFEKMFYDRAGNDSVKMPHYLILFGGASYDYKNRIANNSDFVPVFESAESSNDLNSFSTDDFYGFLDNTENIENNNYINLLDIGVGRLPARTTDDATSMVNKITNYASPNSLGPWRLSTLHCADNDDQAGDHMEDAEFMAATVNNCSADLYNERKAYIDALPVLSTPAGPRCPSANAAIDDQVYKGTFLINYNGHGNTEVWASERILNQDDYNNWQNFNKLPFMVTATCDFGQFDHPQYVSAAEQLTIRNGGGVIAMLTTTQAVYAVYNKIINSQYIAAQFTKNSNGSWNTFGDAERIAKNLTYMHIPVDPQEIANFRKFALLGDAALTPDFPQYNIAIDSIIDGATFIKADTVKALGAYIIKGSVNDDNNNLLSRFTGDLTVAIFDKPRSITPISGGTSTVFQMQDNIIYKGKASVTNGKFSFTFITPKDIYYFNGKGKISSYAQNATTDAAGADTNFVVGGYSANPVLSTNPPIVKPYINDSLFRDGGITGANTSLFVILKDETGINVSGNFVGHDLTAILDGNVEQPYLLNDFYETATNTYQLGYVSFPLSGLANGPHNIKVIAWDVNDNTGTGEVNFVVIDGRIVDIQNLANYPNPFDNLTHFVFEHNHPLEQLAVQIEIYSTAGIMVKKIEDNFTPQGSWSNDITWDGTDTNGAKLPSGVYVYKINVTSNRGFVSSAYQKLVIVR